MVAIVSRTRNLQQLLSVRVGKGAAILGQNVSKIHLDIGSSRLQGNAGAKQFWKEYLPRLKFYNPHIPMLVTRRDDSPCEMTLEFSSPATPGSPSPSSPSSPKTQKIPVKLRDRDSILSDLYKATSAQEVPATPEDVRQQQELNEELYAINELRKKNQVIWKEMQRERALMKAAMSGLEVEKKPGRRRASA